MEVRKLKADLLLKMQHILSYAFIVVALIVFVLSLGFMTNYYMLFYDGTFDMYNFYKDLQVLNKSIFNAALIFVLSALLLIPFDINKKKPDLYGLVCVIGITAYTIISSNKILSEIPVYKDNYLAFDFSDIKSYNPSIVAFDLGTILFQVSMVVVIGLLIVTMSNYVSVIKNKRLLGGSNEA